MNFKKIIEEFVDIKYSKENNQIQLNQTLKYTPTKCEDCPRMCLKRRKVYSKMAYSFQSDNWIHQCSVCLNYKNPRNGIYNTSFNWLAAHFKRKDYRKK